MEDFQLDKLPYYHMVPKDRVGNARFRQAVIEACIESEDARQAQWIACSRDPLYCLNVFHWIYEPRTANAMPWLSYPYQDEDILIKINAIGHHDLYQKKSRDMGGSWDTVYAFHWFWQFRKTCTFLMVSRHDDFVDKTGEPKALFWKFDFLHDRRYVPGWFIPRMHRTKKHCENLDNASIVDGEATTSDTGVAGRYTAVLDDEFAKMRDGLEMWEKQADVTFCRIAVTTPEGKNNCAYDVSQSGIMVHNLDWHMHPDKRAGLYKAENGKVTIIDKDYVFPPDYTFITSEAEAERFLHKPAFWEGDYRSVWFDAECKRRGSKRTLKWINQEVRADYIGSGSSYFDTVNVDDYTKAHCMPPFFRADLKLEDDRPQLKRLDENDLGLFEFWVWPDGSDCFPKDRRFGIGVDVSQGRGASNSAISVVDLLTGEKVCQFINSKTTPPRLAYLTIALGYMFAGNDYTEAAMILYEANGPGLAFGDVLHEHQYPNVFYRESKDEHGKPTKKPGWWCTVETKGVLFESYHLAMQEATYINRSEKAVKEIRNFSTDPSGLIVHTNAISTDDPAGARSNHGDITVGDALANMAYRKFPDRPTPKERDIPRDCMAARAQRQEEGEKKRHGSDRRWCDPLYVGCEEVGSW